MSLSGLQEEPGTEDISESLIEFMKTVSLSSLLLILSTSGQRSSSALVNWTSLLFGLKDQWFVSFAPGKNVSITLESGFGRLDSESSSLAVMLLSLGPNHDLLFSRSIGESRAFL